MPNYRRARVPGGCFFFTQVTDRRETLFHDVAAQRLLWSVLRGGVWQPRFWEHTIRDEEDFEQRFDYVHYNPVKHGLVKSPSEWPWSSFHRWVRLGVYPPDWASGYDPPPRLDNLNGKTGE